MTHQSPQKVSMKYADLIIAPNALHIVNEVWVKKEYAMETFSVPPDHVLYQICSNSGPTDYHCGSKEETTTQHWVVHPWAAETHFHDSQLVSQKNFK